MATISHNDLAPRDEEVTYSLGSAEPFTLLGDATYEVVQPDEDDRDERVPYDALIANARTHPWLNVEVEEADLGDADAPAAEVDYPRTAIDASLDQNVVEYEGDGDVPIAETHAADDEQGDEPVVVDEDSDDENDKPVDPAQE